MTIDIQDIESLLDDEVPVFWDQGHIVDADNLDELFRLGPKEFYADIPAGHPKLDRNRNGTHFCTICRCVVILFDDDSHTCTLEDWKER